MENIIQSFSLSGKCSLVTGASKGIGASTAQILAEAGSDVVITGRDLDGLKETQENIESLGRKCLVIEADLSLENEANKVADKALEVFGTIDILVNNAGTALLENILSTSNEDWDKVQSVNLKTPFILAKLIAPNMIKQKSGKIVNISSVASEFALQDHIAYSVSKSGLNMLTKSMTVEWAKHNIQTNSVCPTIIMTTMGKLAWGDPQKSDPMLAKIPSGRFGEPREVANLVLFLCSPASNFISGQSIFIDGGFSIMWFLEWKSFACVSLTLIITSKSFNSQSIILSEWIKCLCK